MNTVEEICLHQEIGRRKKSPCSIAGRIDTKTKKFKVDNKDTRAMPVDVVGIVLVSLLLKVQSYQFDNVLVSSLTCQYNASKITQCKTI